MGADLSASQREERSTVLTIGLVSEASALGAHHRPRKQGSAPRCRPLRPRKRGKRSTVPTASASQARQRSTGADRIGLASEAALHGCRPHRPRKRGNAPRSRPPGASPYHLACLAASVDSPSYQYVIGRQSSFGSVDRTRQRRRLCTLAVMRSSSAKAAWPAPSS